jgi:outer membrane murein-binding lipoprotein Lpp
MIRFNLLTIAVVGLLALTGCKTDDKVATIDTAVKDTTDLANTVKDKATNAMTGFTGLTSAISATKTAVETGDFAKAKIEVAKFEGYWSKVENDVKAKSPDVYEAIETSMKTVETAVNSSDKTKALDALKSFGSVVTSAAKP